MFSLILSSIIVFLSANSFGYIKLTGKTYLIPIAIIAFLACNVVSLLSRNKYSSTRLRVCAHGAKCLEVFLISTILSVIYHIVAAFHLIPDNWSIWLLSALICILVEAIVFWNGIISVYCTSIQLGIRRRGIGMLCSFIPIVNIFVLHHIIKTCNDEVNFELKKDKLNLERQELQICKTKYPILLVHGVFFRDFKYLNYWGRIPSELEKNGASIFYGNHQSASSINDSAKELSMQIKQIVTETGCDKVNIIAHSKGGLDCKHAICSCDIEQYVASLTTINTPHKGCEFADYLLTKIPQRAQQNVASTYNFCMQKLGDTNSDFMAAVNDLTHTKCLEACSDTTVSDSHFCNIYTQSVGSQLNNAMSGRFPLNFSYLLAKQFDGANDGLVSSYSSQFGDNYTFLKVNGKRGISHADMIDLNRENIPEFDVREFYVKLIADLKKRGF